MNRVAGEKVYDELDLKIGHIIFERRRANWSLDAIFEALPQVVELRPMNHEETSDSSQVMDETQMMEKFRREFGAEFIKLRENILEEARTFIENETQKLKINCHLQKTKKRRKGQREMILSLI